MVYILFVTLEKIVPLFPLSFWHFWANIYANIFYYLIPVRKKTAFDNLRLAFGEKSTAELQKIIKGAYKNIFIVIFEFFYMRRLDRAKLGTLINIINPEIIEEGLKKSKGIIFVSGHFGNWELMAYGCAKYLGHTFNVIVKEQSNKMVDKKINMIRESAGNKMIEMSNALREVLKLLRENKIIAMLGDQSAPKEGSVKVNFFVKDVPAFEGAARFAIKTGAAIIFGYSVRQKDNTYILDFKAIDTDKYKDYTEENIRALTQEHTTMLEDVIRKNPDQWLWFHRRFKHVR